MTSLTLALLTTSAAPAMAPDADAIAARLEDVRGVDTSSLEVTEEQGNLHIGGTTSTLLARDRALLAAAQLQHTGPLGVDIDVDVPTDRTDWTIDRDVMAALATDPVIDTTDLLVDVDEGVVTLRGVVGSDVARRVATRLARGVRGVQAVVDQLDVMEAWRADADIIEDVRAALAWDVQLADQAAAVRVDSRDGAVRLTGTVATETERHRLANLARVSGVRSVDTDDVRVLGGQNDPIFESRAPVAPAARAALEVRVERLIRTEVDGVEHLDAEVAPDHVRLTGLVPDAEAARQAVHLARQVTDRRVFDDLDRQAPLGRNL